MNQGASSVVFLVRSLEIGGAERQLVVLAAGLARHGVPVCIATFYPGGPLQRELETERVSVVSLGKRGRWDLLGFSVRLVRFLRRRRPRILYSYLTVPNVLSAFIRPLLPGTRCIWALRASYVDLSCYDWLSRFSSWIERALARRVDVFVANSYAGKQWAISQHFPEQKITVIPNGIDTSRFRFSVEGRRLLRSEWGIADSEILIGVVARLDPMKDHPTFLRAADLLSEKHAGVRFLCIGDGASRYRDKLVGLTRQFKLSDKVVWVAAREEMRSVYSAIDIACSSSAFGEGFPNVVAEAMACERPCVVTDVGDSGRILGDTGRVVPPGRPDRLAEVLAGLVGLGESDRRALGIAARARIEALYGVDVMVRRTMETVGVG